MVSERGAGMSKYLLNKFLYTVDRDPELVERYRSDPAGCVEWWEAEMANTILNCHSGEGSTWLAFTDEERGGHLEIAELGHGQVAMSGYGSVLSASRWAYSSWKPSGSSWSRSNIAMNSVRVRNGWAPRSNSAG